MTELLKIILAGAIGGVIGIIIAKLYLYSEAKKRQ